MMRIPRTLWRRFGVLLGNVTARSAALLCTFAATLMLARNGGTSVVGIYALLHVLPGLIAMLLSSGLPVAIPYFLAGPDRENRSLPLTVVAIAVTGGAVGAALWMALVPFFGESLLPELSLGLAMLSGLTVLSRSSTITAKSCSQGSNDLRGANRVIFTEEFMFLPAYGLVWGVGLGGGAAVVVALLLADVTASAFAWTRLVRRRFFRDATRPSPTVARSVAAYGMRAQIGGVMTLLNLRLDFVIVSLFLGPAVLGVYAVASKFAELVRIPAAALMYVLYPRFAKDGPTRATARALRMIPKAALLTGALVGLLWLSCGFIISSFYGADFDSAITPARIILVGLAFEGVAGVTTAFLYGVGRPGLNSWAMGAGLVMTVVLDVMLIPRFGATGAAVASAVAYLTSTAALVSFFWRFARPERRAGWEDPHLLTPDPG